MFRSPDPSNVNARDWHGGSRNSSGISPVSMPSSRISGAPGMTVGSMAAEHNSSAVGRPVCATQPCGDHEICLKPPSTFGRVFSVSGTLMLSLSAGLETKHGRMSQTGRPRSSKFEGSRDDGTAAEPCPSEMTDRVRAEALADTTREPVGSVASALTATRPDTVSNCHLMRIAPRVRLHRRRNGSLLSCTNLMLAARPPSKRIALSAMKSESLALVPRVRSLSLLVSLFISVNILRRGSYWSTAD